MALPVTRELQRFVLVGAAGFAIDASIFVTAFQWLGWSLLVSRAISFSCAATATWSMNRKLTFPHRKSADRLTEWARYIAVNIVGALLNLGIFIWLMQYLPDTGIYPLLALGSAATIALIANYLGSRYIAFYRKTTAV